MRSNGPAHIIQYDTWSQKNERGEGVTFKPTKKLQSTCKTRHQYNPKIHTRICECVHIPHIYTYIHTHIFKK